MDALAWHRFQFAFTITYHYLFPQLTMGLALLIVIFKALALKHASTSSSKTESVRLYNLYDHVADFWGRIFAINFAVGVATGIPMEFQFGTNWGRFSTYAGPVIGTTLAMEGMFAFFAESAFLGIFLFGKNKVSALAHFLSAVMLWLGSWLSGYFIIVTNAFMQHPVGYQFSPNGNLEVSNIWAFVLNPWALVQYAHTMCAAVVTGSFVVSAVGAFWLLMNMHKEHARICIKVGVIAGLISCLLQGFPTGDQNGKMVAKYQRPALAAMEGKFKTSSRAELAIIGQPDLRKRELVNPIMVPEMLSFLAYGSFGAKVEGMDDIPKQFLPDNVVLLYYAYHIMVGLGTMFVALTAAAAYFLYKGSIYTNRLMLWLLMLAFPFPYIATTAGWLSAELGRQPWLVYGLLRTEHGTSPRVYGGDVAFSTLGFMGLYMLVGLIFVYLVGRQLAFGPQGKNEAENSLEK